MSDSVESGGEAKEKRQEWVYGFSALEMGEERIIKGYHNGDVHIPAIIPVSVISPSRLNYQNIHN